MSVIVDIQKHLGDFCLNAHFCAENEVLALLGASGCGKSMTLKCIAGMERPDCGRIIVDNVTLFDSEKRINLTPQQRRTGLVFQNYALFPNMTVLQNIRAGARREKNKSSQEEHVRQVMQSFGLTPLANHYPSQLSGGQQQRTALARVLVSDPRILLLDEPFSALDSHLRFQLEQEVRQVIRRFSKTVILVSHDRDEVFRLSDSIAVMNDGQIEAFGSRADVFANPQTCIAARLTGCKNISRCRPLPDGRVFAEDWGVTLRLDGNMQPQDCVGIRMHDVIPGEGENSFLCLVSEVIENPFSVTIMLRPKDQPQAQPFGMELDKKLWEQQPDGPLMVHFPARAIVSLKETDRC